MTTQTQTQHVYNQSNFLSHIISENVVLSQINYLMRFPAILDLLYFFCLLTCTHILANNAGQHDIKEKLKLISMLIEIHRSHIGRDGLDIGRKDFWEQHFANYTLGLPVFVKVVMPHISLIQFGNYFGSLLNDYACAIVSGAHFILFRDVERGAHPVHPGESIYGYIPYIVPHYDPAANVLDAVETSKSLCSSDVFVWEDIKEH